MKCERARPMFSAYLDGAVTGRQMRDLSEHLEACGACSAQYDQLQQTQRLVAGLGRKQAPPELALRLRVALSQQAAQQRQRRLQGLLVRLQDAVNAFMLPATAGVVSAVVFFGLLIGFLALPGQLSAANDDVPTLLYTPPQLRALPADMGLSAVNSEPVVVETFVDSNGRVQDYRIISGPAGDHGKLLPQLNNIMIFTTFRPATSFGVPTSGRVVLSFSKINVKG